MTREAPCSSRSPWRGCVGSGPGPTHRGSAAGGRPGGGGGPGGRQPSALQPLSTRTFAPGRQSCPSALQWHICSGGWCHANVFPARVPHIVAHAVALATLPSVCQWAAAPPLPFPP